jgi:hypothetical protein
MDSVHGAVNRVHMGAVHEDTVHWVTPDRRCTDLWPRFKTTELFSMV